VSDCTNLCELSNEIQQIINESQKQEKSDLSEIYSKINEIKFKIKLKEDEINSK
jgi:hypothetical protein